MSASSFHFSDPNLDASEKLRELSTFLRGGSHLLQENAEKLETYFQFLEDELEDNPRAQDFLREATAITQTINLLARMLEPESDIQQAGEPLTLYPLLQGVINRGKTVFQNRKVTVELTCPDEVTAYGDTLQLQQLIFSILNHLIDARKSEHTLFMDAVARHLSSSELHRLGSKCQAGDYVELTITPQEPSATPGVTFNTLANYFAQDQTVPLKTDCLLAWLGVLKRHGGDLLISTPGKDLAVKLLIAQNKVVKAQPARHANAPTPKGTETILLVDDEDMIWELAINTLSDLGYTVLLAGDGQEAIETYRANPGVVDLIIMDMVMPGINGREAFEQLKKIDPNVKVLLSSGYVSDEDAHFVLKAGALGFLRKPYSMKKLGETVREILDRKLPTTSTK